MKEEQMKNERIKISEGIDFDKKNNENISQRLTKQVSFNFSETEFKKEAKKRKKKIVVENTEETEAEGKTQCIKNCLSFLKKVLEHTAFYVVKILFIFASCTFLINSHPQISRTSTEI